MFACEGGQCWSPPCSWMLGLLHLWSACDVHAWKYGRHAQRLKAAPVSKSSCNIHGRRAASSAPFLCRRAGLAWRPGCQTLGCMAPGLASRELASPAAGPIRRQCQPSQPPAATAGSQGVAIGSAYSGQAAGGRSLACPQLLGSQFAPRPTFFRAACSTCLLPDIAGGHAETHCNTQCKPGVNTGNTYRSRSLAAAVISCPCCHMGSACTQLEHWWPPAGSGAPPTRPPPAFPCSTAVPPTPAWTLAPLTAHAPSHLRIAPAWCQQIPESCAARAGQGAGISNPHGRWGGSRAVAPQGQPACAWRLIPEAGHQGSGDTHTPRQLPERRHSQSGHANSHVTSESRWLGTGTSPLGPAGHQLPATHLTAQGPAISLLRGTIIMNSCVMIAL